MDCLEGLPHVENESIDLIITDPPFALDFKASKANYNRKDSNVLSGYVEIAPEHYLNFTRAWMQEAFRCLKTCGSMFVFSGWTNLKDILIALDEVGFVTVNHIIWKYQFGVVCKRKFVTSHYHCLYVCKNDKTRKFFNSARYSQEDKTESGGSKRYQDLEDVWHIKREYWRGQIKTQNKLPSEIIQKILLYTSEPGDLVLDPFIGSGQVAVVCKQNNRKFIGFEIVSDYYTFAKERIENT